MDSRRFDRLTRLMARPASASTSARPSRRQVIRGVAAGLVTAVAVARSPRPAAAALCPERVPVPGYRPDVNGCGPSGYGWAIPDSFGDANFTPACNQHDRCYGTCNSGRRTCDVLMRKHMKATCDRVYRNDAEMRGKCRRRAQFYFNVVHNNGQSAYEDAQMEACFCCTGTATRCGNQCCPTSQCYDCIGGSCQYRCQTNDWCNNNVCQDCGEQSCGGG